MGGHPLAGTEESGWGSTDPLLFRDAPWTLTLEDDTDLEMWLRLAALVCDLGAKPVPTTAAEQDTAVARVIGLPHVLAEALALTGLDGGPLGLSLAAGSYMSGSRVARTRPELVATWCDDNPPLVDALDDVISRLTAARDELAAQRSVLDLAEAGYTRPDELGAPALRAGRAGRRPRRPARPRPPRRLGHRRAARRRRGAPVRYASGRVATFGYGWNVPYACRVTPAGLA